LQVIIEEAQKMDLATGSDNISTNVEEMLSRPATYNRIKCRMTTKLDHSSTLLNGDVKRLTWNHMIYRYLVLKI
jgi:hypothetical protein